MAVTRATQHEPAFCDRCNNVTETRYRMMPLCAVHQDAARLYRANHLGERRRIATAHLKRLDAARKARKRGW